MPAQRQPHYLDEALNAAIALPCDQIPSELARVLINLCGAVRALERDNGMLSLQVAILRASIDQGEGFEDEAGADPAEELAA